MWWTPHTFINGLPVWHTQFIHMQFYITLWIVQISLCIFLYGQLVIPQTGEAFSSLYEKLLAWSLELSQQFAMNDCACTHMKIEQVVEEKQLSYSAWSLSLPDLSSTLGVIAFSVSARGRASTTSPGLIWKSVNGLNLGLNIMHIHQPHIYSCISLCICIEFDYSYLDYDQD